MQLNSFYYFVSNKSVRWIIMSLFAFQIKEESGDNKEYITFESIIKIEPCDNIEDTTLLPIVKQESDDEAEAQIWNFRENAEHCFLKREVKEEEHEDDDDVELENMAPSLNRTLEWEALGKSATAPATKEKTLRLKMQKRNQSRTLNTTNNQRTTRGFQAQITPDRKVKVEPGDSIEDTTLEPIVKLDPDDEGEAQIWNFREKGEHCFLKREVKEENEVHDDNGDEDDIEEEIKPPARVFLESEESWNGVINQELEQDPLAMCNESFNGKNSSFVDGEYSTSGELHTQVGSTWEKSNGACNKGNGLTPHNAEGKLKKTAASDKESVNDTRLSNPDNSRQKGERSVTVTSVSESQHVSLAQEEKSYKCSVCQRKYNLSSWFVRRMRNHSRERSNECFVCQKRFTRKSNLVKHMLIHTGERPYNCPACEKSFTQSGELFMHMRVHSGDRPHECSVCLRRFKEKGNLVNHMRIHSGEFPYECSLCKKIFVERSQ